MVQTGFSSAVPVAFALVSNEDANAYVAIFLVLLHFGAGVFPRYVMSDDSNTIIPACSRVFANADATLTKHLLCIWHTNTAILRATKKATPLRRDGSYRVYPNERKAIYNDVKVLANATSPETYDRNYRQFKSKYRHPKFDDFMAYFDTNYHAHRQRWSRAFRDLEAPITNNVLDLEGTLWIVVQGREFASELTVTASFISCQSTKAGTATSKTTTNLGRCGPPVRRYPVWRRPQKLDSMNTGK